MTSAVLGSACGILCVEERLNVLDLLLLSEATVILCDFRVTLWQGQAPRLNRNEVGSAQNVGKFECDAATDDRLKKILVAGTGFEPVTFRL